MKKGTDAVSAKGGGTRIGKGKRVPTGLPGTPRGLHDVKNSGCRCGRCGRR